MTQQIVLSILTFLLGGVIGGYIQAIYSYKKEVLSNIWLKRYEEYKIMWEISGVLPKYPEDKNVTYKKLHETCIKIKDWYFENGGIILSKKSRGVYEQLQKNLSEISEGEKDQELSGEDYKLMRNYFSLFRSELTSDLTSRNKSLI